MVAGLEALIAAKAGISEPSLVVFVHLFLIN